MFNSERLIYEYRNCDRCDSNNVLLQDATNQLPNNDNTDIIDHEFKVLECQDCGEVMVADLVQNSDYD